MYKFDCIIINFICKIFMIYNLKITNFNNYIANVVSVSNCTKLKTTVAKSNHTETILILVYINSHKHRHKITQKF